MKKPTPKRQAARSETRARYHTFQNNARKRLGNTVNLTLCPSCKEPKMTHALCMTCGKYNGRQAISMQKKVDKITKIKA